MNIIDLHHDLNYSKNLYVRSNIPIAICHFSDNEDLKRAIIGDEDILREVLEKIQDDGEKHSGGTYVKNIFSMHHQYYNILTFSAFKDKPVVKKFKEFLFKSFKEYSEFIFDEKYDTFYTKVWMNQLVRGEFLEKHCHSGIFPTPAFTAQYDLVIPKEHPTFTCYFDVYKDELIAPGPREQLYGKYQKRNEEGALTLLPFFVPHRTTEVKTDEYRYTFGMDIIVEKECYEDRQKGHVFFELKE